MRLHFAMLTTLSIAACSNAAPIEAPIDLAPAPAPAPTPDPAMTGMRYISLDIDALDSARLALAERDPGAKLDVVDTWNDVAIVRYDAQDFRKLSELMHGNHGRCGGFVVHESLDEALGAFRAKDHEGIAPLIAYTIDNAATVDGLLPQLSATSLLGYIQNLVSFGTRYYTSAGGGQASNWVRATWSNFAAAAGRTDVTVQLFETGWTMKSVIATIPGSTLPNEVIVLGAHLDSIAPSNSSTNAPGADDDASGVATLTETLRVLMAQDYRPARTVKFMAYAAEEVGLLGSKQIVQSSQATGVVGVMQLDMTNYKGSANDIYIYQDYTNAAQNTFLGSLVDTYLPGITRGTDSCGYGCSDHASWYNAGFPTSLPFESRMSQYNPNIHTSGDTLAVSGNNANHAIKFAKLATAYVAEIAKGQLGAVVSSEPVLSISAPASDSSYQQGTPVTLAGSATDAQDGTLSASIQWASSLDGSLGTGDSRTTTLSVGTHTITARIVDSSGLSATATTTVTITSTATDLFRESFESATSWSPTGLWHQTTKSACASPGYASAMRSMYFGSDSTCNYATSAPVTGTITSPVITGVAATSALSFKYYRKVESDTGSYDVASVEILSGTTTATVWSRSSANPSNTIWNDSGAISLAAFAGRTIQVRFKFDSVDYANNAFTGWLVDDVVVTK
jgi:leucyl aminopeptidase